MDLGLTGKLAVVTGGSRGLGKAIVRELLAEGAAVAICSRTADELAAAEAELAALGRVFAQVADVTDPGDVQRFVDAAAAALGGIDILVNNAGAARPGRFATLTDEDWHIDLDTKLFSVIRCTRAAVPHMRARGGGRIVNIGAVQGRAPDARFFTTSTIRAAGNSLTKVLAQELAADGILVTGVNIGLVTTPQWTNIRDRTMPGASMAEFTARITADVPLGRFGTPEEVSGVVAFLASARASYLTGTDIDVAGGMGRFV
ncbi:SDR family oxidoreductase [Pseudonocardia thermophila]|uniref:SDR family oxidoreductase n=1 Tax=Pseudonocardia thermophila TaxID=1848 RepID=UPI00248E4A0F|nr:SDR family oxidoreductase [Pseudonocardia thermophila]